MAYFPNGTSGLAYEARWCDRCVHTEGCTILLLHLIHNYDDCNNPDSMLHTLIPRTEDGLGNEKCTMFYDRGGPR